jgi:heparan-alpha-glucosaminide N-acetyltransferase
MATNPPTTRTEAPSPPPRVFESPPARLVSLDAYRGLVMLAMVSGGLGLAEVARRHFPERPVWRELAFHTEHVAWEGCSFWDLIQPSFMFMVGVALSFSLANRRERGQAYAGMFGHAVIRALALIGLGILLRSTAGPSTNFTFVDVLTQIGLGYVFVFLLWGHSLTTQLVVAFAILASYWSFMFFHPIPAEGPVIPGDAPLPAGYVLLEGIRAPWNIHINSAADFDRWFLNLFPRHEPFKYNSGGYQTLNFVPSIATMIFGLIAGDWLRSDRSRQRRCLVLFLAGAGGILAGYLLHISGVSPVIKRIWSPSWTIYSAGWASVMLGAFVFLFDVINLRPIAWPLTIVGRNSLSVYVLYGLTATWILNTIRIHLGAPLFRWIAPALQEPLRTAWRESPPESVFALLGIYQPIGERLVIVLALWLVALWMYRRKLFLRI